MLHDSSGCRPALASRWDDAAATSHQPHSTPERRLLLAVLSDAIVVLTRRGSAGRPISRRDVAATTHWVRSDDREWPCSFVNICEALGVAYQPLRRALLAAPTVGLRRYTRRRLRAGKPLAH